MKYLHIETNALVDLVGRNDEGKIDWDKIGTSPKLINLNPISISKQNSEDVTCYILPVSDEPKATTFIEVECKPYNVFAELISEEKAIEHKTILAKL